MNSFNSTNGKIVEENNRTSAFHKPQEAPEAAGKEPETIEELDTYLQAHGYDPDMVGRWGKAIADAAFARAELADLCATADKMAEALRKYRVNEGDSLQRYYDSGVALAEYQKAVGK